MRTDLGNRCSEDNDFIEFTNTLHELINTRTFDNIDIMILTLDLNWYGEVSLVKYLLWSY